MIKEEMTPSPGAGNTMELLGDYLKQKRLDKNYSLEKLSQKTKISVNILKSLEANDFDHLPSAAYIKGFVISYVKVLGLPVEEAINKMEFTYLNILGKPFPHLNHTKGMISHSKTNIASKQEDGTHTPTASPHEVIKSGDSVIQNTKSFIPIAILTGVVVLFIGGYKLVTSIIEKEANTQKTHDLGPKIESSSALVNINERKNAPRETVPVESTTSTKADAKVEPVKSSTETVTTTPSESTITERSYPTVEFKPIKSKLFEILPEAEENENEDLLPEDIKDQTNSDLQNVYIRAVDGSTWLSYKIDNKPIVSSIIQKDTALFIQGSDIRIFLGNVGVTKIFYNNKLISTPTKTGVKTLIFPEENNSKYVTPLFPKAADDILYTAEEYQKRMKLEEDELAKKKVP